MISIGNSKAIAVTKEQEETLKNAFMNGQKMIIPETTFSQTTVDSTAPINMNPISAPLSTQTFDQNNTPVNPSPIINPGVTAIPVTNASNLADQFGGSSIVTGPQTPIVPDMGREPIIPDINSNNTMPNNSINNQSASSILSENVDESKATIEDASNLLTKALVEIATASNILDNLKVLQKTGQKDTINTNDTHSLSFDVPLTK